ncbi:MAG: sulfurtransferase-like selenium metabolism protein YedF [Candidatus Methylomirabilis oxygeniifera]|nr:MAG: sulfurtransferase-like selenium metabolism protein YedF [Candidatus Methylomirabilis oxyfera]
MSTTIIINSEVLGKGPDELGERLMGSFLRKLCMQREKPSGIVFYNSGVNLLARGSSVLDALDVLAEAGVDLIACGTCVAFYKLKDKIFVGRISDMLEIVSTLMNSEKVITI